MVKKKVAKKKTSPKKKVEEILVKNFTDMQKVMLKLISRFDNLSEKIEDLVELFEDSARVLVKKELETGNTESLDKEILERMNQLMDQNKIIAKGLTLMHDNKPDHFPQNNFIPGPQDHEERIIPKKQLPLIKKPNITVKEGSEEPVFKMPE